MPGYFSGLNSPQKYALLALCGNVARHGNIY